MMLVGCHQQSKMKMKLGRVVEFLMVQTQHQTKTQNHVAVLEKQNYKYQDITGIKCRRTIQ